MHAADTPSTLVHFVLPTDENRREELVARLAEGYLDGTFVADEGYAFEYRDTERHLKRLAADAYDPRFEKLLADLSNKHVGVELQGSLDESGFAVVDMVALTSPNPGDSWRLMAPGFLATMVDRLRNSPQRSQETPVQSAHLSFARLEEIAEFLGCVEDTLPPDIRAWAHLNLDLARDGSVGKDEKRHAMRALSLMLRVQWESAYFEHIDPREARRILDEELYGLDSVKQRVIETIIQINRTHRLPFYGILLVGPPGTGKSRIAYAVARILKLPWTVLDMSAIRDASGLTGTPRIYANAMCGRIMQSFIRAGRSNLVFVVNELDKAEDGYHAESSADALLTLFDNLGFTDNYLECAIPTEGVYPIATANDISKITGPLLSRFAVIHIDDYTPAEKRVIFCDYSLPKVIEHLGMKPDELTLTPDAIDEVIRVAGRAPGCRDLEQAAEHLAAHALYLLELSGEKTIVLDKDEVATLMQG
ncbi:MAG: AAA family ATPase [Atopobiaceae bacterium]|jgi:ATP-dependent Lon protease